MGIELEGCLNLEVDAVLIACSLVHVCGPPTTMIKTVYFLDLAENISHCKIHVDRIPFDLVLKCI